MRSVLLLLVLFIVAWFSGIASAGLSKIGTVTYNGQDYNLIYDDNQGLIWLDYSHVDEGHRWFSQMKWVAGLNNPEVLTYNLNPDINVYWEGSWRLPKAVDGPRYYGCDGTTTAGYNITTSEMGHLFYVSLGNLGYYDKEGNPRPGWGGTKDQEGWGLKNTGPFINLQPMPYWTCTDFTADPDHAWDFHMYLGSQDGSIPIKAAFPWLAIAVRPGKISTTTAP